MDIHESSLEFQKKVRETYLSVAETDDSLQVINCNNKKSGMLSPCEIFDLILDRLKEKKVL